ncbi:MAG: hypothetical protein WD025_01730 [Bacteriovoracaceae bacterium]
MSANKRREALLNEYKGNIYEFLVAQNLSQIHGVESSFIKNIGQDFYEMLSQQESYIREYYPWLLSDLPLLARGMALEIDKSLKSPLAHVKMIGKASSSLKDNYGEEDILAVYDNSSLAPISLKLSKAGAFVNTKSAGVKSFLKKYFHNFPNIEQHQLRVSDLFDRQYELMSYSLQEAAGMEPDGKFENWKMAGATELPGELSPELRERFLETLRQVNNILFETLLEMANKDQDMFLKNLKPLLGRTRDDMLQATTFYERQKERYALQSHIVESGTGEKDSLEFLELKNREAATSFDIVFADRILQIRLKAMNKFTSKGFKINCAVKRSVC